MDSDFASGVDRFVVVDVETTGLYNNDRVVEVAAVTLSGEGTILDEWDTLVNPERDVGPTAIHGVTASMVSAAPRFEEAAAALAGRLHGAILVAHNLVFDSRMLRNEYQRLGASMDPGKVVAHSRFPDGAFRMPARALGSNSITIIELWPTPARRLGSSPPWYSRQAH